MGIISNDTFFLFKEDGTPVSFQALSLSDTFLMKYNNKQRRYELYVKDQYYFNDYDIVYVVRRDGKIIIKKNKEDGWPYPLGNSSFILGVESLYREYESILLPFEKPHYVEIAQTNRTACRNLGQLITNNEVTDYILIGILGPYILFRDKKNRKFSAYTANFTEEDEDDDYYYVRTTSLEEFKKIIDIEADFALLWNTFLIYFNKNYPNKLFVINLNEVKDSESFQKEFELNIFIDFQLISSNNWEFYIYPQAYGSMIIIHSTGSNWFTNQETEHKGGFTLILFKDPNDGEIKLCNQNLLGGTKYNVRIENYLLSTGKKVYNMFGKLIASPDDEINKMHPTRITDNFLIIKKEFKEDDIKTHWNNTNIRYGVIGTSYCQWIIPPNFNKIDFELIKWDREESEGNILIKTQIETMEINNNMQPSGRWGLFLGNTPLLPCYYKDIKQLAFDNHNFIIFESYEGKIGVIYKNEIIAECVYKKIDCQGDYLILWKEEDSIQIIYLKEGKNLSIQPLRFSPVKGVFEKLDIEYYNDSVLIIEENNKFGVLAYGEVVLECNYDKIQIVNGEIPIIRETKPIELSKIWFKTFINDKVGLFYLTKKEEERVYIEPEYNDIAVVDWMTDGKQFNTYSREIGVLLNNKIHTTKNVNHNLFPLKGVMKSNLSESLTYRGFISSNIMLFSNDDGSSVELFDVNGNPKEVYDIEKHRSELIEDEINVDIISNNLTVQLFPAFSSLKRNQYIFSRMKNEIIENPFYDKNYDYRKEYDYWDNDPYDEPYDYERDTYYALGGDDYEAWKERGGDLDRMMEGMGL